MSNPESGGTGSTINMDNFNPNNTSPDDSGWSRPYELGLLHELAHAAEMDKGTLPQGQTGGVDNSEIDACKKTNDTLKELKKLEPDIYEIYDVRRDYGGVPLPKKAYE